jgi:hypothetical protein
MASPLAIVSMGMSAAGGIIGGIGAKESADAQAQASSYKAGVAQLNKQINLQNAAWATEEGGAKGEEEGLKSGQEKAQTLIVQAASGIDVNSGTAKQVRTDQTTVAQYDQNVINWNAAKTAWGFETKATMNQAESQLDLAAADNEKEAGTIGEWTSFLNAGGSVADKYLKGSSTGIFT